jgi:hypothetical protein
MLCTAPAIVAMPTLLQRVFGAGPHSVTQPGSDGNMIGVGYGKSASEMVEKFSLDVMDRLRLNLAQNPGTV